jgi:hypothetical protein
MCGFPMEWEGRFPDWVRQELMSRNHPYDFYSWHLTRLSKLDVEMRKVWELLQNEAGAFCPNPVLWLLQMLHGAYLGLDPEKTRDQEEKEAVAANLQKSLDIADRWIGRLMNEQRDEQGKVVRTSGMYPMAMETHLIDEIKEEFTRNLGQELRDAGRRMISHLKQLGVEKDGRKRIFDEMTDAYFAVEGRHAALLRDSRQGLAMLVDAAEEWSGTTWAYKQFVVAVGQAMKTALGRTHPDAVAILASAIFKRTVNGGAVREMLRREGV